MESSRPVQKADDPLEVRLRSWGAAWGAAAIRVTFFVMVAGWFGLVGNYVLQDVLADRNREAGLRAAVVGAMATVVFVVAVVAEWRSGWRAVVADRREPTYSQAVRDERDRRRRRSRTATRWTVAAGCVGLLLAGPVGVALADLHKPDDMWPKDQLEQFDVVVDDAGADAAQIEGVLLETASRLGLDAGLGHTGSREKCRLPDGSVGMYVELDGREYSDPTNDQAAAVELVSQYWDSLGYSVGEVHEAPVEGGDDILIRGDHSLRRGRLYYGRAGFDVARRQFRVLSRRRRSAMMVVAAGRSAHRRSVASGVAGAASHHDNPNDNLVIFGSPGTTVDHASELDIPAGHVYKAQAKGDPIDAVDLIDPFGPEPASNFDNGASVWGGTRIRTDGASGHSEYMDSGTESLMNMSRVIAGQHGSVTKMQEYPGIPGLPGIPNILGDSVPDEA